MRERFTAVGPEYLTLALTAVVSAITSGSWVANKILTRTHERIQTLNESLRSQENRVDSLEQHINRMPLEYVLKVDFLREIQNMHDNFQQINNKLDKLMEKLLTK
jgi:predicted RNase H-like nuclease (RuvC/YqgF family)